MEACACLITWLVGDIVDGPIPLVDTLAKRMNPVCISELVMTCHDYQCHDSPRLQVGMHFQALESLDLDDPARAVMPWLHWT